MTKLNWGSRFRGQSGPLPSLAPRKWIGPAEKAELKAKRNLEKLKRETRCEKIRYKAIIKKFGLAEAVHYGVPAEYIEHVKVAEARAEQRKRRKARNRLL